MIGAEFAFMDIGSARSRGDDLARPSLRGEGGELTVRIGDKAEGT